MPIALAINGVKFEVPSCVDPTTSLNEYLRCNTPFKGSKLGCGEGGCGACAVEVTRYDSTTGNTRMFSLNSCLCPVGSLDGAAITTAEGLGNSVAGFHPIQERLAGFHGSQCGFCTPGMIVACHATLAACKARGQAPTDAAMEKGLDGNICRCTGYRSIIDACKTFSGHDIEDLGINVFGNGALPDDTSMETPAFPPGFAEYAEAQAVGGGRRLDQAGRTWASPRTLEEAFAAMGEARGAGRAFRVLAGNTGAGVYKDWPDEPVLVSLAHVQELRQVSKVQAQGGLRVGGAVTLAELVDLLGGADGRGSDMQSNIAAHMSRIAVLFKHLRGGAKGSEASPATQMAAHIARIAGQHVRAAATVGGNLALTRNRRLESDLAPLLLAAGARVTLASEGGVREVTMEEVLDAGTAMALGTTDLVVAVTLPAARSGEVFWSHRVSHRYSISAALINAAFNFQLDGAGKTIKEARVVFGLPGADGWEIKRAPGVEAVLAGAALAPHTLVAALEALPADTKLAPREAEFVDAAAQGILLEALAPLVQQIVSERDGPALAALLAARRMAAPEVVRGVQDYAPPDPATAPVGEPIEKDRVKLQASGEAIYTSDIVMPPDGLYGVFVESTKALAELVDVDPAPALALPGVATYVDVRHLPKGGANRLDTIGVDVIFADGRVEYVGQRIGMVLAESQTLAETAAKLVRVRYAKPAKLGEPLLTIQQAIQAESFYDLSAIDEENCIRRCGDAHEVLLKCAHTIKGARFSTPSQQHMYMEPQAAVALPDEGGSILVHSSTQCIDMVQTSVAAVLNLPYNKDIARVRRLGGGFGGKSSRSIPPAAAAAVAAYHLRRPVRVVLNRNADLRMIGGRNEMDAEFDVGFDAEGRFEALAIRAWLLGGAQEEISAAETQIFITSVDQNYAIPHLAAEARLVRTNLPPRTIMRGPGTMQAVLLIEHIIDRIAAHLGLDPVLVRECNLLRHPKLEVVRRPCAGTPAFQAAPLGANKNSAFEALRLHHSGRGGHGQANGAASGSAHGAANGAANGAVNGAATGAAHGAAHGAAEVTRDVASNGISGVSEEVVLTALRSNIPLDQFTVPRLWYELKDACRYEERLAEIQAFNRDNLWRKRGICMTTCRFVMTVGAKPATVHVYHDGTVLVLSPGHEMGQGLFTKVRQAAAMALSDALPPAQRPFPLELINIADNASDLLPNAGPSWGSTTSEASCEAVRLACRQLVAILAPHFIEAGEGATWQEVIKKVHPEVGFSASKVLLTATSYYDGTQRHTEGAENLEYNGYGSAASEVEIDVLTGESRVRRGDIMIDAGHSLNPAVDIGQAEGGYVQGLGMMLTEDVKVDLATGRLLSDSTWSYKVPSAETIPREMYVHLLKNSPHARGILSSKAVGEPPLLLAVSAFSAVQMAVNAARADLAARGARALSDSLPGGNAVKRLRAPATPARIKAAIGSFNISELLRAAT